MPPSSSKPKSDWVETETGNKVSRRAQLHGTQHVTLGGRCVIHPTACLRGDLVRPPPSSSSPSSSPSEPQPQTKKHPVPSITLAKYTILSPSTLLKPPPRFSSSSSTKPPSSFTDTSKTHSQQSQQSSTAPSPSIQYTTQHIGSHTFISPHATVEAAQIGDRVVIGEGAVVGKMAILKDGCVVLRGAVVPGGMVVGPGLVVGGRPARVLGSTGVGWGVGEDVVGGEGGGLREVWRGVGRE